MRECDGNRMPNITRNRKVDVQLIKCNSKICKLQATTESWSRETKKKQHLPVMKRFSDMDVFPVTRVILPPVELVLTRRRAAFEKYFAAQFTKLYNTKAL